MIAWDIHLFAAAGLVASMSISVQAIAGVAPSAGQDIYGYAGPSDIRLIGGAEHGGATSGPNSNVSAHKVEVQYLPACASNSPEASAGADVSCPQAAALCRSTADPHDSMFWRFERVDGGPWRRVGEVCLSSGQVPGGVLPGLSVADFRRLPLPAGTMHIQPPSLRTLVNVPTNVYVTAAPLTLTTTLLGQPVRVRATPVSYRWTFGDGGTLATADAGRAYPAMTTTHTYRVAGQVTVGLTTVYRGEYSVSGGAWLPVDGTAEVTSPTATVTVVATRNELVADILG